MNILSFNPGHDGAFAYLENRRLIFSLESEKHSHYRHSPLSVTDMFDALAEINDVPDVVCQGGWWPNDANLAGQHLVAGYRGIVSNEILVGENLLLGKKTKYFSSSHERSHLLCSFGMSDLTKGTPCYALLWEGVIGAFYSIDPDLNITKIADVMPEPGHRYAFALRISGSDLRYSNSGIFSSVRRRKVDGVGFVLDEKQTVTRGRGNNRIFDARLLASKSKRM
jgi:predicted NodU family carbamoyl transferase